MKKILVISSPSGGGKSTVAKYILNKYPKFAFSISATTRKKRVGEEEGINYFYLSEKEFLEKISGEEFIEYEKIFDNYYGSLKSNVNNLIQNGKYVLFDVDVKGALNIKKIYSDDALLLFILPPSVEVLEARLRKRESETDEQISNRLSRYKDEVALLEKFDVKIINGELINTFAEIDQIISHNFEVG